MCICDIRDARKLDAEFARFSPKVVLHAAAYKHVPLMELEPDEAVKTNVGGTKNLLDACEASGVERFVLISTDKAVAPQSVMGITKAVAERLMLDACSRGRLKAVAVRFGNVLGSRGSVIPLFQEQLKRGGPILVTHEEVTRYFMTIPEAARLVLQAQAISDGGDLFVLEMGEPVKIVDLARKMIALSGIPADIEIVGLRPAEKLHEILTTESEDLLATERDKILRLNALPLLARDFRQRAEALDAAAQSGDIDTLRDAALALVNGAEKAQ
jgi:FlaA1/EpsC-like NDP-sugar epimerase